MAFSSNSDFGSEDEDAEFALYAKLYFDQNENVDNGAKIISLKEVPTRVVTDCSVLHPGKGPELPRKATTDVVDRSFAYPTGPEKSNDLHANTSAPLQTSKYKKAPLKQRERNASICSVESISGKVPLDGLYCNVMDSLDEKEEEEEELSVEYVGDVQQSTGVSAVNKKKKNIKKRKKPHDSDSEVDSRCKNLELLCCKNKNEINEVEVLSSDSEILDPPKSKKRKKKKKVGICNDDLAPSHSKRLDAEVVVKDKARKPIDCISQNAVGVSQSLARKNKSSLPKRKERVLVSELVDFTELDDAHSSSSSIHECIELSSSEIDSDILGEDGPLPKLAMNFDTQLNCNQVNNIVQEVTPLTSLDFTKRRPLTKRTPSCSKWTPEMISFYDSDDSDFFDVEEIHDQQSSRQSDWKILSDDYAVFSKRRYYNSERYVRCHRCKQSGHLESKCPKDQHCHLCSATDHATRNECPNNCCLRCGGPLHKFCHDTSNSARCSLCGGTGHFEGTCPDIWRRYHVTISGSLPVLPESPYNIQSDNRRKYCCSCGRKGHFGFQCKFRPGYGYYIIQGQSIASYSQPVETVDEGRDLQLEEAKAQGSYIRIELTRPDIRKLQGKDCSNVEYLLNKAGVNCGVTKENNKHFIQIYGNFETKRASLAIVRKFLRRDIPDPNPSVLLKTLLRDRKRNSVLRFLREKLGSYRSLRAKLPELPAVVDELRKGKCMIEGTDSSSPDMLKEVEKSLHFVSRLIIGCLKRGEAQSLFDRISSLQTRVGKYSKRKSIALHLVEEIASTFEKIECPPLKKLDEILNLAEMYLQGKEHHQVDNCQKMVAHHHKQLDCHTEETKERAPISSKEDEDILHHKVSLKSLMKNRNKETILVVLRNKIRFYDNFQENLLRLPAAVDVLRQGQKMNGDTNSPSTKFLKKLDKSLRLASRFVFGYLKQGEGKLVLESVAELICKIWKLRHNAKVPKPLLEAIASSFQKIDRPSSKQLDQILTLTETYLEKQGLQQHQEDAVTMNECDENGDIEEEAVVPTSVKKRKRDPVTKKVKKAKILKADASQRETDVEILQVNSEMAELEKVNGCPRPKDLNIADSDTGTPNRKGKKSLSHKKIFDSQSKMANFSKIVNMKKGKCTEEDIDVLKQRLVKKGKKSKTNLKKREKSGSPLSETRGYPKAKKKRKVVS